MHKKWWAVVDLKKIVHFIWKAINIIVIQKGNQILRFVWWVFYLSYPLKDEGCFFVKIASKQPLLKARWLMQSEDLFWYFQL
jgi:hypothetical protein